MTRNARIKKPDEVTDIARNSKFTPERRAKIINDISRRIPYELAAEANGICEATLYDWLNTGKAHQLQGLDTEYTKFSESIKRAELDRVLEHTDMIAAKPERWQADAWMLERRWPKYFGNNVLLKELNERMNLMAGAKHGKGNEERNQEDDQA
jgi:transposase-like protein